MSDRTGKVYLVGAGPGSVAYLTLQGQHLIQQAEVLIYDALVDETLLQLIDPNCLAIDVGKRGGQPSWPQEEINQLLVEHCRQGKQVIRLKSGDPFIFGRCMSEIQALAAAECDFEVVPGISSVFAGPLLAGIPLTDPVLSRYFAVASGHDPAALDWETLGKMDTLVILMGTKHLGEIVRQLRRQGRSLSCPIAIIRWAGTNRQKEWIGTLGDIVEKTMGVSLSPAVIVIGEVVKLQEFLRSPLSATTIHPLPVMTQLSEAKPLKIEPPPAEKIVTPELPLADKLILVTRSAGQSGEFCDRLQAVGATTIEMPTLEIGPPSSWEPLDQAIADIESFHWIILTSTNGVESFFERLFLQGKDARAIANLKIAVVGRKTAESLTQKGLQADFIPPDFVADSLVEHFPESLAGQRILFPRVETGGRQVLVKELTTQGAEVIEVAAYESRCPDAITPAAWEALQQHRVHVVTFASSKTVQYFCQLLEKQIAIATGTDSALGVSNLLQDVCVASIGPQTSKTCQQLLGRFDLEATEYTLEGLTNVIVEWADTPVKV